MDRNLSPAPVTGHRTAPRHPTYPPRTPHTPPRLHRARARRVVAACVAEGLERRTLFAAVTWTGSAGNDLWTSAGNWSNNLVPTAADDVTISTAAVSTIRITTGTQSIRSLSSAIPLAVEGGTLAVSLTASLSANLTLGGGTISGGTYTLTGGSVFAGSTSGGTLTNVAITGDVVLGSSQSVLLSGTTTFTTARLQGSNTDLRMAPGFTLNSAVVAEGASIGTRFVTLAVGGTGTVTIGAAGSVQLASSSGGGLNLRNSSAATLNNNGTIANLASGQTLSITNTTFRNNSQLNATSGTTSVSPTTFRNFGTVSIGASATLDLGGTFDNSDATGSFGTFSNAGGTVNLSGTLDNTGSAFALNASTGSFTLLGGTIANGNVLYAGGSSLRMSSSGGTLSSVSIGGEIVLGTSHNVLFTGSTTVTAVRLQGSNADLRLAPAFNLASPVIADGAAAGTRFVTLASGGAGTVTVNSGVTVRLDASSGGPLNLRNSSAATLVNNGTISAEAPGQTLTISNSTFTNNGTARATSGTLAISPTNWTNPGTVGVAAGSVVSLEGTLNATGGIGTFNNTGGTVNIVGTLNNTGSSFTLNASTGSFTLLGGTITGGTINYAAGQSLLMSSSGGTLSSVAINGDIVLNTSHNVLLNGTTTFTNARLRGTNSDLRLAPGFTLSSTVLGEGTDTGTRFVTLAFGGPGTVTLSSTGQVRHSSTAGGPLNLRNSSAATLVNNGLIINEAPGHTLSITNSTLTNSATLSATAGVLAISPTNWTNTGTIAGTTGATINLEGTFDATTGRGTFNNTGATINVVGTILNTAANFILNSSTGVFTLRGGTISGGTITYLDSARLDLSNSGGTLNGVNIDGDLVLAAGQNVLLTGATVFDSFRLTGSNADLRLAPDFTLNSPVVAEGIDTGTRFVTFASGGPSDITIGAAGSITLLPSSGGPLNLRNSSAATIINNGLISAESAGQTLSITTTALTNNATVRAQAGTLTIAPTNWTNPGTISLLTAGTVNLGGTLSTASGIGTFNNAGGTVNITGTISNSGNTFTLNNSTGSFNLVGGTVSGGSINYADGRSLLLTSSGGTLQNVVINGELLLPTSANVLLTGTTRFTTARLQGANADLRLAPDYVLDDDIVADTAATGTRFVTLAVGGSGTVSIGTTGSITLAAGSGGNLNVRNSSAATLLSDGLISSESPGLTLTINNSSLTNNGTLRSTAGTLTISPSNWTNPGTISASTGATVNLDGNLDATVDIGTLSTAAGTLNITGNIANSGATLALNTATGSPVLLGGTITGGSISYANSQRLRLSTSGGTLSNVSIGGELILGVSETVLLSGSTTFTTARLQGNNSDLRLAPGYTLNSVVSAEGSQTSTRFLTLAFGGTGTVTVGPSGIIRHATGTAGAFSIRNSSAATLVNNGVISAEAAAQTLTISNSTLSSSGTLRALAGTLNISPSNWTNTGTIAVLPAATVRFEGNLDATNGIGTLSNTGGTFALAGNLDNSGSTLTLNATTGSIQLLGGDITGGVIVHSQGSAFIPTSSGGSLTNVALTGDLILDTSASLSLAGTTTFTTLRMRGSSSNLNFITNYTLNSTVLIEGAATGTRFLTFAVGGSGTVTIGPTGVIRQDATSGGSVSLRNSSAATVVNQGLIAAESVTEQITVSTTAFTNTGTLRAAGGTLIVNPQLTNYNATTGTLTGGTYDVSGGGLLRLSGITLQTLSANVVLSGSTSRFQRFVSSTASPLLSGTFTVSSGASITATNGAFVACAALVNQGTLTFGVGSSLSTAGNFTNTGTLSLQIGGVDNSAAVFVGANASLGGTLLAPFLSGFTPFASQPLTVISAVSLLGTFPTFTSGVAANGARLLTSYTPTNLVLFGDTALPPSTPALAPSSDSGFSNIDRYTAVTTLTLTGTAEPNTTVLILENGNQVASTVSDANGNYQAVTSALADGIRLLSARAIPSLGSPQNSPGSLSVTIDTQAPTLTPPNLTPTITQDPNGAPVTFVATATDALDNDPSVSYSIAPGSLFALGTTPVTATAIDRAGNSSSLQFNVIVSLPILNPVIGGLDNSFGNGMGIVTVTLPATQLTSLDSFIFGDGSVLTAGFDRTTNQLVLSRLGSNGALDITFGNQGTARFAGPDGLTVRRVQFAASGNVYLLGTVEGDIPAVARYAQSGERDGSFGTAGLLTASAFTADSQIDAIAEGNGRSVRGFLVAGNVTTDGVDRAILVNVLPDFSLNSRFGNKGSFAIPSGEIGTFNSITLTPRNAIFLGGTRSTGSADDNSLQSSAVVVQLSSAGRPARFGTPTGAVVGIPGFAVTAGQEVLVQADGKVLLSAIVAASASDVSAGRTGRAVIRLTSRGLLDPTFNGTGSIVVAPPSTGTTTMGLRTLPFARRPIEQSFDLAQSSLVLVTGGKVREIAAVVRGSATNLVQSQVIADAVDLVANGLTVSARKPVKVKAKLTGSLRLSNAGTLPANGNVPISVFLSSDNTFDPGDTELPALTTRLSLRPGTSRAIRLAFVAPEVGGDFFLIAVVNNASTFAELRTDNGQAVSPTPFTVLPPPTTSSTRLAPALSPLRPFNFSDRPIGDLPLL